MEKKDSIAAESSKTNIRAVPDPEVTEKAVRRKFTAAYKLRIVKEAQTCTAPCQREAAELPIITLTEKRQLSIFDKTFPSE